MLDGVDSWEKSLIDDILKRDGLLDNTVEKDRFSNKNSSLNNDIKKEFNMAVNTVAEAAIDSLDFMDIGGTASAVSRNLYSSLKKETKEVAKKEIVKDTVSEVGGRALKKKAREAAKNVVEDISKERAETTKSFGEKDYTNFKIHKDRQDKHIEGTKNYKQQINNGKHPSILKEDPDKLLKEGMGKGENLGKNKEVVDYGKVIGKYYDIKDNKYYDTTRATIHYDSKGNAHIVPAKPNWLL